MTDDLIDTMVAALNMKDLERFVACYASSAAIEDGDGVVLARGHEEIRMRYRRMFTEFPILEVAPRARWDIGTYVIQDEHVTGRARGVERHVAVYRIVGDRIAHERLLR